MARLVELNVHSPRRGVRTTYQNNIDGPVAYEWVQCDSRAQRCSTVDTGQVESVHKRLLCVRARCAITIQRRIVQLTLGLGF